MKILQIATSETNIPPDKVGSPEGHIFYMSKQLSEMGHEVTILGRRLSKEEPSVERINGVKIVRLSAKHFEPGRLEKDKFPAFYWLRSGINSILFTFRVSKYLNRANEFDVINTYVISVTFLLLSQNRKLKTQIFYNHQANILPPQPKGVFMRLLLLMLSFVTRRVKGTIVQNNSAKLNFVTHLRLPEKKVVVIPAGLDMNLSFTHAKLNDVNEKYQLNKSKRKVILFSGRIHENKGVEHLVRAADILVNQYDYEDVLFVLAGPFETPEINKPGKYTNRIFNLVKIFNLEDHVRFTGYLPLDDLRGLYLACDIFVLPSVVDQFPLVVIEAMASGKPVVATKTPGALMQVIDSWNGFLVEIGDEKGLAKKIRYLLDNSEEAKLMGANGMEFAKEFSWSIVAHKYLEFYRS